MINPRRPASRNCDDGYAMLFVLFVITVIMIVSATMLTVVAGNAQPTKRNQDASAALIAAQAGIQNYISQLNAFCSSYTIAACPWLQQQQKQALTGTIGQQSYSTSAQSWSNYIVSNNGTLRVSSTGISPTTAPLSNQVKRTIVADISALPSALAFTYFTNYETVGKTFLDSYFPPRTIPITSSASASAAGLPIGSTVTWSGTASAPVNGYTDSVCNALWYDDPTNPSGGAGRATIDTARTGLGIGTDFAEDGYTTTPLQLVAGTSTPVTRFAPCAVTFTNGMNFTGPVYSRDAYYLSNGTTGSTSGPSFSVPTGEVLPAASSAWTPSATPAAPTTGAYHQFPMLGGTPASGNVSSFYQNLSLPSTATPAAVTCTYSGPTRILLSGTTATITSPLTSPGAGPCYTSTQPGVGVVAATVPITTTTVLVNNSASALLTAPTFPDFSVGGGGDITSYSRSAGDAYVQGTLTSGKLSLVTQNDIVVTGDIKTYTGAGVQPSTVDPVSGERSWSTSTGAIDLVATNNVRLYHPVACLTGVASSGYCPNDIGGLYTLLNARAVVNSNGTLKAVHPSLQYCNVIAGSANCSTSVTPNAASPAREIDAAVFALNGSFYTDNFNRGLSLGAVKVDGGVYQNHRGPLGMQWEEPTGVAAASRAGSGYVLQITYLNYQRAQLGYVPPLQGGQPGKWHVVRLSTPTGGAQ